MPFEGVQLLQPHETERMVFSLLNDHQRVELEENLQVDFSFGLEAVGRFRANAYKQRNSYALALRVIPFRVRPLEDKVRAISAELIDRFADRGGCDFAKDYAQ